MASSSLESQKKTYWWILGIIGVIFVLGVLFFSDESLVGNNSVPQIGSQTKIYQASEVMGRFTIEVPEGFEVEEKSPAVVLKKNSKEISIIKSSTNFSSLKNYIIDLDVKNKKEIKDGDYIQINGLDALRRTIKLTSGDEQRNYYIIDNDSVYTFSTSIPMFFLDLDQIAQSFKIPKE